MQILLFSSQTEQIPWKSMLKKWQTLQGLIQHLLLLSCLVMLGKSICQSMGQLKKYSLKQRTRITNIQSITRKFLSFFFLALLILIFTYNFGSGTCVTIFCSGIYTQCTVVKKELSKLKHLFNLLISVEGSKLHTPFPTFSIFLLLRSAVSSSTILYLCLAACYQLCAFSCCSLSIFVKLVNILKIVSISHNILFSVAVFMLNVYSCFILCFSRYPNSDS